MTYLLAAIIVAVATAAQVASGFGFALLTVPLLTLVVGAKTAVVTTAVVALGLQLTMTVRDHTSIRWSSVASMTVAALVGIPLGLLVLVHVGERALTIAIALSVLVFAALLAARVRLPVGAATDAVAGLVSGTTSTATGTSGPPLVLALHARDLPPVAFRATLAAQFLIQGVVSVLAFALADRITGEVGRIAAACLPALAVGWLVGERIFAGLDRDRFRRGVLAMLVLSALAAVAGAVVD